MATLIEVVDYGNRLLFSVYRDKATRMPDPIRIPRPSDRELVQVPRVASADEMRHFFKRKKR